MTEKRSIWS